MNKRISMLILLLIGSMLFVSCKKKETNINEKTGELYISYNGEIQQFDIDTESVTGLIKNIESLAWLAPRGGLEMELVGEDISEEEKYIFRKVSIWIMRKMMMLSG